MLTGCAIMWGLHSQRQASCCARLMHILTPIYKHSHVGVISHVCPWMNVEDINLFSAGALLSLLDKSTCSLVFLNGPSGWPHSAVCRLLCLQVWAGEWPWWQLHIYHEAIDIMQFANVINDVRHSIFTLRTWIAITVSVNVANLQYRIQECIQIGCM